MKPPQLQLPPVPAVLPSIPIHLSLLPGPKNLVRIQMMRLRRRLLQAPAVLPRCVLHFRILTSEFRLPTLTQTLPLSCLFFFVQSTGTTKQPTTKKVCSKFGMPTSEFRFQPKHCLSHVCSFATLTQTSPFSYFVTLFLSVQARTSKKTAKQSSKEPTATNNAETNSGAIRRSDRPRRAAEKTKMATESRN